MKRNHISFRLIISWIIVMLLCLCPLHVNAQKIRLGKTTTKALNKTQRVSGVEVIVPKSSRRVSDEPRAKVPMSVVDIRRVSTPASAAKLRKTPDSSILNPPKASKDLRLDVNSNISPLGHIEHYTTPNSSITTDISNKWVIEYKWLIEYIWKFIEEQKIQQGKEKIEQLFDNKKDSQPNEMEKLYRLIPIRHDIKQEGDRNTSYIYYCAYGYELAA